MISWPSIPRRWLLRLAGVGFAAAPLPVLAERQGGAPPPPTPLTTDVWTEFFKGQRIWAYVDRQSLAPGDPLYVMAAAGPGMPSRRVRLEVFRMGASGPEKVWVSDFANVGPRGATASAASIGPGWPPSFGPFDTRAWPPGVYSLDIVEQTTATRDVRAAQWIVTNPRRSGAVLVRLGTNTWQAYNPWGGHSLYPNGDDVARGLIVTFDRPTPPAFFEYDSYLVTWLEGIAPRLGGVDYAGNFDVHADPALLDRYRLVITGAHDEYWSGEEFSAFQRRIFQQGRNVAFLGADGAYCQVRYGDLNRPPGAAERGRQVVCFKTGFDPVTLRAGDADPRLLETSNFRTGARRPETMLMGGAYQSWFEPAGPQRPAYRVAAADHPWFAGTGLKAGDAIADVVGYEWDNRDPAGDGKRLWEQGRSLIAPIPAADIRVLMHGEAVDADGKPGVAEATVFRSRAGATVFNAGSIRWSWGLGKEGFVRPAFQRFNETMISALARG